jgi:hypothetical protein
MIHVSGVYGDAKLRKPDKANAYIFVGLISASVAEKLIFQIRNNPEI